MKKKSVAILGATGTVGQKCIELLQDHPWFEVTELVASERSAGRRYADVVKWRQQTPIPSTVGTIEVRTLEQMLESSLLFSGLDSTIAGEAEIEYARRGHFVVSNSKNHRLDDTVPLIIPEINCDHLAILKQQKSSGKIVTNSNCSTMAFTLAVAPLEKQFGIKTASVCTLQAVSGAGYPGVASLDIIGNIIPYIEGEEEKIETEPLKILGTLRNNAIECAQFDISAQCTRVPVVDGHTELVSLRLANAATIAEIEEALRTFTGNIAEYGLPSAPHAPIHVSTAEDRPQVLRDVHTEGGMAITVGRVRQCPINDVKFVILEHNTVRGAAGAALLNAEACVALGYLQ